MRITRKVFHDLAIWQIGFGLCIGLAFPFFIVLLGAQRSVVLTPRFFAACLFAGALAGVVNYAISRHVVGARLTILAERMTHVSGSLGGMTKSGDLSTCSPEACAIVVDSEDEIGESASAFNRLVEALSESLRTQLAVRSFSEMLTGQLEIESLATEALRQFREHADAAGGLILYETGGELRIAASFGLRDPEAVATSGHVDAAVRSGERQVVAIPEDVVLESVLADFRPGEVRIYPITHILKSVCAVVRSSLREGDVLLRYGGEEFLAVMPAASGDDLREMGERLRRAVEDSSVADGDKTVRVTISAGGAAYPRQNVEREDGLIELADEALYRAKEGGRNRVETAR